MVARGEPLPRLGTCALGGSSTRGVGRAVKPRHSDYCLATLSLMAASRLALADATPPIVRVYVAGPPEAVSKSRDAVQDLCLHSNVAVIVRDAAGANEALLSTEHAPSLAEAYVDLRPGSPTRVVVVDGESRQDLERRTLPEGSSLEISIETVARSVLGRGVFARCARGRRFAASTG